MGSGGRLRPAAARAANSVPTRPRSGPHVLLVVENVALARDHRLQKQAATLASNGYRVSVICRADPANRQYPGVRVYEYRPPVDGVSKLGYVREYAYSWLMAAYLTVKAFRIEPFDAIQVGGPPDIYFALAAPFKLLGRVLVVDQRALSPELYELRYGRRAGVVYRTLCWLERRSNRVADRVITANQEFEELMNARGDLPAGKVTLVGNGPELAWDRQESAYLEVYRRLLDGPNLRRGSTRRDGSGSISIVTRARNRLRSRVSESPALYLPLARRKYPGPSPQVINSQTELVIDAYTRAATTFAVYAFQLSQEKPVRLAHHLHAAAQVIEAARRQVPALLLIREPQGTILSQLAREPWVTMADALVAYTRYYRCLLPYRNSYVIGEFEQVTRDFGAVIRRLNARFGTNFAEFVHTEDNLRECFQFVALRGTLPRHMLGFESGTVTRDQLRQYVKSEGLQPRQNGEEWIPAENRERVKAALLEQWAQPSLARLRHRAQLIYRTFAGDEAPDSSYHKDPLPANRLRDQALHRR